MDVCLWLLTGGCALVIIYIYKFFQQQRSDRECPTPPCLPHLPIVGSLPFLTGLATLHIFFAQKAKKYGNVFSFYAGQRYVVVLNGMDAIREAFLHKSGDFAGREPIFVDTYVWNPNRQGIAFKQYGEEFKAVKRLCMSILREFGFGNSTIVEKIVHQQIEELVQYTKEKKGAAFDMRSITILSTLNIVYTIIFGKRFSTSDASGQQLLELATTYSRSLDPILTLFPFLRFLPNYRKYLKRLIPVSIEINEFFKCRIEACLSESEGGDNFVSRFMAQAGSDFDRVELMYIVKDLVLGGTETSSTQLRWAVLLICNHAEVQERLHEEIDSVVNRDKLPSLSDRPRLRYLDATILEVFRLKVGVPLGLPHTTLCDTEVGGYFLPANTQVLANLWSVMNDEKLWTEPDKFTPERFLNENGDIINQDHIVSFSLGKRSCPGESLARQEIFLILAALLQNFNILPPEGQKSIPDIGEFITINAPIGFEVRFVPRG